MKYLKFRKRPSFTADKDVFMKLSLSGKGNLLMELLYLKTVTALFSLIAFYSQLFVLKEQEYINILVLAARLSCTVTF